MRSLAILLLSSTIAAAPLMAQTAAPAAAPAQAAAAATPTTGATAAAPTAAVAVTQGAKVVDTAGAPVGSIDSVASGVAVLNTGTTKVSVPVTSFASGPNGPVIALTKAEIEQKAAAATQSLNIAVGATVNGSGGAKIGTVTAVNGDLVTVSSATASAQLPKASFAAGQNGLVIGMTAAQFDTAAKQAGGGKQSL
jgi:hypothetical protein